jgi:hypothetical protein
MFSFRFEGGVTTPQPGVSEKFLLFFLVGQEEIPLYDMLKLGLVRPDLSIMQRSIPPILRRKIIKNETSEADEKILSKHFYISKFPILKIFCYQGTKRSSQKQSFALRLLENGKQHIMIRTWSDCLPYSLFCPHAEQLSSGDLLSQIKLGTSTHHYLQEEMHRPVIGDLITIGSNTSPIKHRRMRLN